MQKNEEERLRARTPQHLLLIDIYVRMLEYESVHRFLFSSAKLD